MDKIDAEPQLLLSVVGNSRGGIGCVIPSDGDEMGYPHPDEGVHHIPEGFLLFGGVEPGDPEDAPSVGMDAADPVDGEGEDFFLSPCEVGEAVVHSVDLPAGFFRLNGDGAYDAVDPRSGASAADDGEGVLNGGGHRAIYLLKM